MKDYYRILQVHDEAEQEVIEAAYKRLMRKYHPDVFPAESRNDPQILQKAMDINEAFENLSDPEKRARYDQERQREQHGLSDHSPYTSQEIVSQKVYEKSFLFVRCSQTKEVFKGLLIREQDTNTPYELIDFEPVPDYLPSGKLSILEKIKRVLKKRQSKSLVKTHNFIQNNSMADEEFQQQLNHSPDLTMGDIDWGFHSCPSCAGSIQNPNGTWATWVGCSKCGHIRCAGSIKETKLGKFSTCPWCGKKNRITRSVKIGNKDHLKLHGLKKHNRVTLKIRQLKENTTTNQLPIGEE